MIRYVGIGLIICAILIYLFFLPTTKDEVKVNRTLKSLCILLTFLGATFILYSLKTFIGYMLGAACVIAADVILYFQWRDFFGKSEKEIAHVVKDMPNMRVVKIKECISDNGWFRYFMEMAEVENDTKRYLTYFAKIQFLEIDHYYLINRQRVLEVMKPERYEKDGQEYIDITDLPMSGFERANDKQILSAVGILG